MELRGRRLDLVAVAALASILMVAEADVVFGGRTFQTSQVSAGTIPGGAWGYPGPYPTRTPSADPGAAAWTFQPHALLAHRLYARGELPLWNPHEGLGVPFAAEMQTAPFSPLRLPTIACPTPAVEDATCFGRLLLAGLGAFLLALRLGVGRRGAVLSGTAFMLTGFFAAYTNTQLDVDIQLPWVLLAFDRLLATKTSSALAVAAVAVALSVIAGFPESTFFVLAMTGVFYLFRAASPRESSWRSVAADLARFGAAVALGHLLAAFVLLPFVEFLGLATVPEHPGTGASGLSHYEARTAVTLLVPNFFGPYYQEWDRSVSPLSVAHYLGVVPVFLALLALGRGPRGRLAAFLAAFAGVALLKVYGAPGLNDVIGRLPVFRLSFFSRYFQPEIALATALLAGIGLARLAAGEVSRRQIAITGACLLGVLGVLVGVHHEPLAAGALRVCGLLVGAEVAFLAVAVALACLRGAFAPTLLVALAALELGIPVPRERPLRHDPFAAPPFVEALEKDESPFRIFTTGRLLHPNTPLVFGIDDARMLEPMYPARYVTFCLRFLPGVYNDPPPGTSAARLFECRRALSLLGVKYLVTREDLLAPSRLEELAIARTNGRSGKARFAVAGRERDVFAQAPPAETVLELDVPARDAVLRFAPVLHALTWKRGTTVDFEVGVESEGHVERVFARHVEPRGEQTWPEEAIDLGRWAGKRVRLGLVTRCSVPDTLTGWGEVRLARPWEGLRCVHESAEPGLYEARIYENPDALPRAFVVSSSRAVADEKEALEALADPAFDPRQTVLLEGGATLEAPAAVSTATIVARESRKIVVECSLEAPGTLVLLDAYYPGWRATVDGVERPIVRADDLFRAVALERGHHTVELVYQPTSFRAGLALSCLGVVVLVVLLVRRPR